ncbi:hypothetical protein GCM10027615_38980 [Plantactinospora veratri]
MLFSGTKSVVATVAGVAFDQGLLDPDAPVLVTIRPHSSIDSGSTASPGKHLLQQTSGWNGELWGKPARVDAQSRREGFEREGTPAPAGPTTTSGSTCSAWR